MGTQSPVVVILSTYNKGYLVRYRTTLGVNVSMPLPRPGYLSVNEAAAQIGVKPQEIVRLVERGEVSGVLLVDAASLRAHQEKS